MPKAGDRRSFIKPRLLRDRHPGPHHIEHNLKGADSDMHTHPGGDGHGKLGFELATDGIQLYRLLRYQLGCDIPNLEGLSRAAGVEPERLSLT